MGVDAVKRLLTAALVLLLLAAGALPVCAQEGGSSVSEEPPPPPPPPPEPSYYLGNVISIESRDRIYATAYIHPLGISWSDWRQKYFDPDPNSYYNGLLNRLVYMFNLKRLAIAGYGVDDNQQIVYVTVLFALSDSGYYDSNLDCLSILDVFKNRGRGYFDKLEVYSKLQIYQVEPAANRWDSYTAVWENPSVEAAPLWYRIYLSPLITVSVKVAGLPSGYRVSVYAGKSKLGDLTSGEARDFHLKEGSYTFAVAPSIVNVSAGVRYRVRNPSVAVSSSGSVTFEYVKQVLASFQAGPGFERVRVDGSWYTTPTQLWLDAGSHELYAEPSVARQVGGDERIAYRFSKFVVSGGSYSSNPLTLELSEPVTISAEYEQRREFRVSVRTRYAAPIEGWFGEGEVVRVSEPSEGVEGDVKYVFAGWYSGDALYSRSRELSLTVDEPISLASGWERWFKVVVACRPSAACGSEELWFREGSLLDPSSLSFESVRYTGDTRYVFQGWSSGPVTVNSPTAIYKLYKVQHKVRVESGEGKAWVVEGEWVDEGSIATVRVESVKFGFPVQTVLDRFYVEGGSIVGQDASEGWARLNVTAPTTVYVLWRKDYTLFYTFIVAAVAAVASSVLLIAKKGLPALTGRVAAAEKKGVEAKPVEAPAAVQQETLAVQPVLESTQVMTLEYLESEIAKLEEEARRYREYLEKLEAEKAKGKVSDIAYEKLKKEYIEKLGELEKIIKELEEKKKKIGK
jgi:hypothetical protein